MGPKSWENAWLVLRRIGTSGWADPGFPLVLLALVLAAWAYQLCYANGGRTKQLLDSPVVRVSGALGMILWLLLVAHPSTQPFIYFQF